MKSTIIATASFAILLLASAAGQTDTARELKQLQDQRDKAISTAAEPINRRYAASLEQLLRRAIQTSDLDTANKIRAELQKLGVTASAVGAGSGSVLGQTDEAKRNALRTHLRDSKWKLSGGKSFELRADGSTTASWHGRKGSWKVTGPNTAEISITNSGAQRKVTFDDDATTATFGNEGDVDREVATRIPPAN
jgi:hypothetical protein